MNFPQFVNALDQRIGSFLATIGCRKVAPGFYVRRRADVLNVIWVQEHSGRELCCVNLGVHYAFLPKIGTGQAVRGDEIEHPECELRFRLAEDAAAHDQWWTQVSDSVSAMGQLMASRVPGVFDPFELSGDIMRVSPAEIRAGLPPLLKATTRVRAALLLAQLHEFVGNGTQAIEFAELGIEISGVASGPRKALKDLIARMKRTGNLGGRLV